MGERKNPYADAVATLSAQAVPAFSECAFDAAVDGFRVKPGGDVQLTLTVPQSQKQAAFDLTDAVGIMVTIHAKRKRRN